MVAVVAALSVLLALDDGKVATALLLTVIYSVTLWGMWKHKNDELIEE
mgnify:CR=1 FL=1